jgi:hypothetical protein
LYCPVVLLRTKRPLHRKLSLHEGAPICHDRSGKFQAPHLASLGVSWRLSPDPYGLNLRYTSITHAATCSAQCCHSIMPTLMTTCSQHYSSPRCIMISKII